MSEILGRIVAAVSARLEATAPVADLEARARDLVSTRERRSLLASLQVEGIRIIGETKRRSPSAGVLREPFDPVALAGSYAAAGAAAISVVSEPDFFGGEVSWIAAVRARVELPVLRKDFVVSERQLLETVLQGADAILLIAAILPQHRLEALSRLAAELDLDVLLEVHDEAELERALRTDTPIIGVNARNLKSFAVDVDGAARLAARLPADRVAVLESGIRDGRLVAELAGRGLRRFLVGEHLVRAADPGAALGELIGHG